MQRCGSIVRVGLVNIHITYNFYILYILKKIYIFYIFQGGFEILKLPYFKFLRVLPLSEAYSELTQTSEMEFFAKGH